MAGSISRRVGHWRLADVRPAKGRQTVRAQARAGTAAAPTVTAPVPADVRPVGTADSLIRVRLAGADDRQALAQMFDRCTPSTRYRRFHGPVKAIPERYLADALSGSAFHYALVAWCDTAPFPYGDPVASAGASPGVAVALASCRVIEEGAAELGLLIEDAWQRHGVGTLLLRDLVAHARRIGVRVLEAQLLAEQAWIAGLLKPYGACRLHATGNGVLNVTVRLAPTHPLVLGPLRPRQVPQMGSAARQ
jgi:GNAT superfamily N-acetyltransferase